MQGLNGSVVKEPVREVGGGKGGMMPHLEEGQLRSGGEEERVRVGGGRMGVGGLKGVLSLWREKVFALLVQTRLQQMQHDRETHEAQSRVSTCTCGRALCQECRVLWVCVPPEAAHDHFSLKK